MSLLSWISINSKLKTGAELINKLSRNKFNLLLKHIIETSSDEIFTLEELTKLSESLKLDKDNLQLLILSLAHVYKQSSKVILKPTVLQEQLVEHLGFQPEKAEDFVKVWTEETNKHFDLQNAKKLDNISWELNLQSASTACNKESAPKARIQLGLVDSGDSNKENVSLELDKDELLELYNVLEKIQVKFDSIKE